MSFISNTRQSLKVRNYTKQNNKVFNDYLQKQLDADQLSGVMDMIDFPEIYNPLIANIDLLAKQDNLSDDMRLKLADKIKNDDNLSNKSELIESLSQNDSMLAKLNVVKPKKQEPKVSLYDKINAKIHNTYNNINENIKSRATTTKNRIKEPFAKVQQWVSLQSDNLVAKTRPYLQSAHIATRPVIDMVLDGTKEKVDMIKQDYRIRKVMLENNVNLSNALDNGMQYEDLAEGVSNMNYPEVRYGMLNNVDKVLSQEAMTPELADEFLNMSMPYIDNMPKDRAQKILDSFKSYDSTKQVEPLDIPINNNEDVREASLVEDHGRESWELPSGEKLSTDEFLDEFDKQFPNEDIPKGITVQMVDDLDMEKIVPGINKQETNHIPDSEPSPIIIDDDYFGNLVSHEPDVHMIDEEYYTSLGDALDGINSDYADGMSL